MIIGKHDDPIEVFGFIDWKYNYVSVVTQIVHCDFSFSEDRTITPSCIRRQKHYAKTMEPGHICGAYMLEHSIEIKYIAFRW